MGSLGQPAAVVMASESSMLGAEVARALQDSALELTRVASWQELIEVVAAGAFSLALVDAELTPQGTSTLYAELTGRSAELLVVPILASQRLADGVEAVRQGAFDFLQNPIDADEVRHVVGRALSIPAGVEEPCPPSTLDSAPKLLGHSASMRELRAEIRKAASGTATVLVRGETGTGKELIARMVHDESARASGPFVKVHCGALPDNLLESEIFGYERGAFTGAASRKPGRVELAEGGTLFLDEIGDISPLFQLKLLRLLQDREYEALGGTVTRRANVRFVAATHRDLETMLEKGEFRADLFYRLNVVPLFSPALCDRMEDFEELAMHFCTLAAAQNGRSAVALDVAALDLLKAQRWPGNIRELQHFIERLVVLSTAPRISSAEVERELRRRPGALGLAAAFSDGPQVKPDSSIEELESALRKAEKRALEKALRHANGNRDAAARVLSISRRALFYKLREHGIS
jgi:DNA-binding NtrC family response regulator